MKKLLKNTRLHLIVLAVSLFVTTTILGLSAYLTDYDDTTSTFVLATGSQFGITVTGREYDDKLVVPGESIELSPTVTNTGIIPVYVFAEITKGGDFLSWDAINTGEWTLLSNEADGSSVYYYGTGNLAELIGNGESTILRGVTVNGMDSLPDTSVPVSVSIRVYAIQTQGHTPDNPAGAWGDAQSAPTGD